MTAAELVNAMRAKGVIHPFAVIKSSKYEGVAVLLHRKLSFVREDSLMVFWNDGDVTTLDPKHELELIEWVRPKGGTVGQA